MAPTSSILLCDLNGVGKEHYSKVTFPRVLQITVSN